MSVEVVVALITGIVTVLTVIINARLANKEVDAKLDKNQEVMRVKLEELTREVRQHNEFALKIPLVQQQIKSCERRLDNLEKGG